MADRETGSHATAVADARREMLARLLAEGGFTPGAAGIAPRAPGTSVPLTHAQDVLWLLDRATPGLIAYNSAAAFRLRGPLDVDALARAVDALVARHESLRTRIVAQAERPVQQVDAPATGVLMVEQLDSGAADRDVALQGRLRELARRPFDLAVDHAFRATLVHVSDGDAVLLLLTHHVLSDAWSYGVLVRDLSALYAAATGHGAPLAPLALQFGDYAAWQRTAMAGERLQERLAWWRDQLMPPAPELLLPTDRPRPAAPSYEGGRALRLLPRPLLDRLKAFAGAEGATLYMVLLAAYQTVLHRWSGQDDLVTGSAIAGRTRRETEEMIGYFSAAMPLRTRFAPGESFRTLLGRVRSTVLGAMEHQDVPFEALVEELQAQGRPGHVPLFQAVLTMQEHQGGQLVLDGIDVSSVEVQAGTTKFELTLLPAERADGLELLLWFRTDLFDQATADRLLGHVSTLLEAVVDAPETAVDALPLLTAGEREQLRAWNATSRDLGAPTTMTALIADALARDPAGVALRAGDATLTRGELAARGHQLAQRLRALGVGGGAPVGLCLDRSAELVVGLYGILAAGGAWVPLLPDQPPARLAQQLRASGARVVVTLSAHRALLPDGVTAVELDAERGRIAALPVSAPESATGPDDLAYVLFTSGSTGEPKGVAVTHANLVHYTRAIASVLGLELDGAESWQCASVSTLAADLGHTSVFPALAGGGTLHLLPTDVVTDPARFQAYVEANPLDLLKITPGHLQALVGAEPSAAHLPRRWLVLGGEACSWSLADRVRAPGTCRVLNHYGPTETTVGACTFEVGASDVSAAAPATVPIGRPLPNVTGHVVDARGEAVPVGVPGELWIGGAGVTVGYLGRDDLTAERFVVREGERCYRSGDRVRRLPAGDLEFLGRMDEQVKVRGHRVEPGEIEAALLRDPAVAQAVVVLRDDELVAYLVPAAGAAAAVDSVGLRERLAAVLPDYMVPSWFVGLETLPRTSNGKVDRAALPHPASEAPAATSDGAPRSETEAQLAVLWAEVLKRDQVGVHENFFALGGHSLLAIRLLGRIAKTFGRRLPLRALFENPTVAALAAMVDAGDDGQKVKA